MSFQFPAKNPRYGENLNGENLNGENLNGENLNDENLNDENLNDENLNDENLNDENLNDENLNDGNLDWQTVDLKTKPPEDRLEESDPASICKLKNSEITKLPCLLENRTSSTKLLNRITSLETELVDQLGKFKSKNNLDEDNESLKKAIKRYIAFSHMLGFKKHRDLINTIKKEIDKKLMEEILSEMQAAEYVAKRMRKYVCALDQFLEVKEGSTLEVTKNTVLENIIVRSDDFISDCLLDKPFNPHKIQNLLNEFKVGIAKELSELNDCYKYNLGIFETLFEGLLIGSAAGLLTWALGFAVIEGILAAIIILPPTLPAIITIIAACVFVSSTSASIGFNCYKYSMGSTFWHTSEKPISEMGNKIIPYCKKLGIEEEVSSSESDEESSEVSDEYYDATLPSQVQNTF